MKFSSRLTTLLYLYRLNMSIARMHELDAEKYNDNPRLTWLSSSANRAEEKRQEAQRIYDEFWNLVQEAGEVHCDLRDYLWIPEEAAYE